MTPKEERERWIRAGLEPKFSVWDPDQNNEGRWWDVVDAECEVIATCKKPEHAAIVAAALEAYDNAMWKIDPEEP